MSRPGWNGRFATGALRPAGLTLLIVMAAGSLTARRSKCRNREPRASLRRSCRRDPS